MTDRVDDGSVQAERPRTLKWVPPTLVAIAGAIIVALAVQTWRGFDSENRYVLYEVRNSLQYGMSRSEVQTILDRAKAGRRGLDYSSTDDRRFLTAWTHVSLFRTVNLLMEFSGDRLTHADLRGDGGPSDRLQDAPPDLSPPDKTGSAP